MFHWIRARWSAANDLITGGSGCTSAVELLLGRLSDSDRKAIQSLIFLERKRERESVTHCYSKWISFLKLARLFVQLERVVLIRTANWWESDRAAFSVQLATGYLLLHPNRLGLQNNVKLTCRTHQTKCWQIGLSKSELGKKRICAKFCA